MPLVKTRSGLNMHYESAGTGFPFVFISGTSMDGHTWTMFQLPFFSKYFRTIIYDHRGTGKSDKPDGEYATRMFAQDLAELMDELGIEKTHVLGHSMGGRVAQWFAIDYPDKVKSLLLADTGPGHFDPSIKFVTGVPLKTCVRLVEHKGSVGDYLANSFQTEFWFTPEFKKDHPEIIQEMTRLVRLEPPPLECCLKHIIARQTHETSDKLDQIKAPTLVLVGENDHYSEGTGDYVRQSKFLASKIANAQLVTIKGSRHGIFWEKPDEVNQVILEFLMKNS